MEDNPMKKSLQVLTVFLFFALAASAQKVGYNFDDEADFSKYKTYKWVPIRDAEPVDDLTDRQVRSAIDVELSEKRLQLTEDDSPDLYVGYQVSIQQEKQINTLDSSWGYGPSWGRQWHGGWGAGTSTSTTSTISVGTFALDMYDRVDHKLVWRGVATRTLNPTLKPKKRQQRIEKGAAKLLKNYPPKGK